MITDVSGIKIFMKDSMLSACLFECKNGIAEMLKNCKVM